MNCLQETFLRISKKNYPVRKCFFVVFLFFFGTFFSIAQCPTTNNVFQSFCDIQPPTVADLQATDNGGGIAWYDTATSTTPLAPGIGLVNNKEYFLDNSAGNCGSRVSVTVSLYTAPSGQNFQGICVASPEQATIASLNATGNNVQWYTTPFNGTPLASNSVIVSGNIYYAGQTNPITGCLTSRLAVYVVVNVVTVPVGESVQLFCNDPDNIPTVGDLSASGTNNWYLTSTSALVLDPSTPLIDGQTYYGTTVVPPCESTQRLEVTVSLVQENEAGEDGNFTLCESDVATAPDINLFDSLGGAPSNLGEWTGPVATTNGNLGTLDVSGLSESGSPYVFIYTVTTSPLCPPDTATVTIIIEPLLNAGEDSTAVFCENDSPSDLFGFLGGTPDAGGTWSPALASGTGIFNPSVDAPGSYVYTLEATPFCPSASATVEVTVIEIEEAGENGSFTLCESDISTAPDINLFDSLGGTPSNLGEWTGPLATTNGNLGTLDISNLSESGSPYVFTYTVTTSPLCPPDTANVTVIIEPILDAGEDGTAVFCENDSPSSLFGSLGGTPDAGGSWSPALASGTGIFDPSVDAPGSYTYSFPATAFCPVSSATVVVTVNEIADAGDDGSFTLCESNISTAPDINLFDSLGGTPSSLGEWTGPLATTNGNLGTLDVSNLSESGSPYVFTYTVTTSPSCPPDTATVTVIVEPILDAGEDGTAVFCENASPSDLFGFLGGTPDAGGTWSPALASGTGFFDPSVDAPGSYTYSFPATAFCPISSATVVVTVNEIADAGENASFTLCESNITTAPDINLFDSLVGTPSSLGVWTGPIATTNGNLGTLDVSNLSESGSPYVFTYTVTTSPLCLPDTATVTVIVEPLPDAGQDGTAVFCSTDSPADLFSFLGGTPDAGGTWSPVLTSGTGIFDPSVDASGSYVYTIPATGFCPPVTATVEVTVNPIADAGGNAIFSICEADLPTTPDINLFDMLSGTPSVTGEWIGPPPLTNGYLGTLDLSALTHEGSPYIFTYTVIASPSCPPAMATITLVIEPINDAGEDGTAIFCDNTPLDLFSFLGGSPNNGGTWTPALASGTGLFDPSIDLPGVYTYNLSGTSLCPPDVATVTVTINEIPEAGENGSFTICEADLPTASPVNLFDSLTGIPSNLGVWTGSIPTANGNLGTLDLLLLSASGSPFVFTYTVTTSPSCPPDTATVTVIVEPVLNAGQDGTAVFCENSSPSDLFGFLGGTPDVGGTWSPALASGTGIFDPSVDVSGSYVYTLAATAFCPASTAMVVVTVNENRDAGENGLATLCEDDAPVDLFSFLGGAPELGGVWSPTLASDTGVFDPLVDLSGVYTYTLTGPIGCLPATATVTVTVDELPTNTLATVTAVAVCLDTDANIVVSNATNLSNGAYQLDYQISGQVVFNTTISVVFENGNTSFTIPASVLNAVGNYTLTISPILSNTGNACGISGHTFDVVSFTIEEVATPIFSGSSVFCETDNATVASLSSGIISPEDIVWYDAPVNGNAYANSALLIDGNTYYASAVSTSGCESTVRLEVVVTINDCENEDPKLIIPDGFSPNGDGINDAFVIKNIRTLYPNFTITIYNRWGNVLFEGNASKPDWDGNNEKGMKAGGSKLPIGVYFYILNFNDGIRKDIQGRVYLSR